MQSSMRILEAREIEYISQIQVGVFGCRPEVNGGQFSLGKSRSPPAGRVRPLLQLANSRLDILEVNEDEFHGG